jgi:hypothetical protein
MYHPRIFSPPLNNPKFFSLVMGFWFDIASRFGTKIGILERNWNKIRSRADLRLFKSD